MAFLFIALVIINCIHDYDTSFSMFFVNNYIVFVLSVTDMAFKGLCDADCNTPKYTSAIFNVFKVFCRYNLKFL